jgi:hypothetical protein
LNLASKSPFDKHYAAPAGVNKSAHGLRKIGATRAANNGATVAALNSIFGWSGSKMACSIPQTLIAPGCRATMDKMRTKYAAPMGKVRRGTSKRK